MKLHMERVTENSKYWNEINVLAKEAFPPEEYIAPSKLVEMTEDNVDFWALSDHELFVGFMVVLTYKNMAYLFFLASQPAHRSKGYGSLAIEALKNAYPKKELLVDFEKLDDHAANNEQRKKRRNFYLRNGYKETGLFVSYMGVDYEVFSMEDKFNYDDFKELMKTIRIEGFNPRYFYK